jgi:hypothetical protein
MVENGKEGTHQLPDWPLGGAHLGRAELHCEDRKVNGQQNCRLQMPDQNPPGRLPSQPTQEPASHETGLQMSAMRPKITGHVKNQENLNLLGEKYPTDINTDMTQILNIPDKNTPFKIFAFKFILTDI